MLDYETYMQVALKEAAIAAAHNEVPVGAVVVAHDEIIARAHNEREALHDPSAHAEFRAITETAQKLGRWRLSDCDVYVTLEPCLMCAGLMINARIKRCIFGARDPKAGALVSLYEVGNDPRLNHSFEVVPDIMAEQSATLLKAFFAHRR